ncbi:MAG TPA: ABC transporter permease [Steroidobacteraceae bacterium]|jgi:sodium transport system permease protein|nr:ABC transporter permease [Steroidobacteraceae bacterium]
MHALFTVFAKEFLENLRDRRTLISALLFGPLFGPLLFGVMVSRMLNQSVVESDEPIKLTISGADRAPALAQYLAAQGVELTRGELSEDEARAAVRAGTAQVVLVIPKEFGPRFAAAVPAPVLLVADSADSQTRKSVDRARNVLAGYVNTIAQLRLQVRGVNPLLAVPVAVNDVDVATPTGRAVVVLGFMTYFVLFAVLMGGLYLAIDSTAGERERGSLEALLSLPVARTSLVGGKLLATCAYMCISLALSLTAFVCVFRFVPLERFGMSGNLGWGTALIFFAICLPFVPLGAALMTFVASFTRSYREAQTYLTTVLLIPTLPIAFASIYSLKTQSSLMFIPSLSQHLLMTSVLKDEAVAVGDVWVSAAASLGVALVLMALTARHWRRETMLG